MVVPIVIVVTEDQPLSMADRAYGKAIKAGLQAEGEYWRDKQLPQHFTPGAKGRYHHQARTTKYLIRKMAMARIGKVQDGGLIDNVYTGLLREFMLTTGQVRATSKHVAISMAGPKYISMVPKNTRQPDKAKEITATTDDDRYDLLNILNDRIEAEIRNWHEQKTTVI
jgi:hypothetical protein